MSDKPTVTVIPATLDRYSQTPLMAVTKKRVAAYARVSTDDDEQLSSYEAQVEFYTTHIKANPDWEFVEVYADEGITGTNTKRRKNFNRMVEDALAGKIDLILTKSVSRFARNTVDTLTTVRMLKEKGVEVFFEKENIYTLDSKGELLITIMSSLAQEESRSMSENIVWGKRKKMQDGKVYMAYKRFLGYEKGPGGTPQIVEDEAKIVRDIYRQFLEGNNYSQIARNLTAQGILTPTGKAVWGDVTVGSILTNEKYAGNAILQKKFTVDFLSKKQKTNMGEVPQYFVEGSHPAIIAPSIFELVQDEIRRRKQYGKKLSGNGLFFGKIICGKCGGFYGIRVWHSRDKYKKYVWQCNRKYRDQTRCRTPHLTETEIQTAFVSAWNFLIADKDRYITEYEAAIEAIGNPADFDKQTAELMAESVETSALMQECIAQNAAHAQNQEEYQKRYDGLLARYEAAQARLETAKREKQETIAQREKLRYFLDILRREDSPITDFSESLWRETVEHIIVKSKQDICVRFKSGTEIHVGIGKNSV